MKKIITLSLICGLVIILVVLFLNLLGKKPLKDLQAGDVLEVEVFVVPPNTRKEISDSTQISRLVDILNNVFVYQKDDSWREYDGQYMQFMITKKNGEIITVATYNPFLIINGVGYKAKYQPRKDLNGFANSIIDK